MTGNQATRFRRFLWATFAFGVTATLTAQIPKQARWEITFAQVEAAADLPDLASVAPAAFEARVMQRAQPVVTEVPHEMPLLRIVQTDGVMRAQLLLFWKRAVLSPTRPAPSDVTCLNEVCVRRIQMIEERDWRELVERLALDACQADPLPPFCADCEHVWIKTKINDTYREQSCNLPKPESPAGTVLNLMKAAADASRRR